MFLFRYPVHMVSLASLTEISRQVRKNMSHFHMGDVISPSEMKSSESDWRPIKTLHFISATGLTCSYGIFSSRLPMISLFPMRARRASQLAFSYERDVNFHSKTIRRHVIGRRDVSLTGLI